MALVDGDGTAAGSGTVQASGSVFYGVTGTFSGSSVASAPNNLLRNASETVHGTSSLTGGVQRSLIGSGYAYGSGTLRDGFFVLGSGVIAGQGTMTGSPVWLVDASGIVLGSSTLAFSLPDPIYGFGILTGFAEVIHYPKPACACTCTCPPKALAWQQDFQRGDLQICVQDGRGNPTGPVSVTFTLYQVVRGCTLKQVGCGERKPASAGLGRYYVTGMAGEGGQPGSWVVRWRFRRTFGEPVVEQDVCFQVQDAIAAGDHTPRACKYGWD